MPVSTLAARRGRRSRRTPRYAKSISFPHPERSPRRRQFRTRASAGVEHSLDLCQNQISPLEHNARADLAVGVSGNRFTVLESLEPSKPPPTVAPTLNVKLDPPGLALSERPEVEIVSTQTTSDDPSFDSNISSKPIMPPDSPKARTAVSCLFKSDDDNARKKPPASLHDFTIPSPLLYHKKSREDLLGFERDSNLNNKKASVVSGQEPSASGCDVEGFALGCPACHLAAVDAEQTKSTTASTLNELDMPGCQDEIHNDARRSSPPLTLFEEPVTKLPFTTANRGREQGPNIPRLTRGCSLASVSSNGGTHPSYDPTQNVTDGEMANTPYTGSESSCGAKSRTKRSMSQDKPNPHSMSGVGFLKYSNFTDAKAAPSLSPLQKATTRSRISPSDGIVNLEACPTPSCTALLARDDITCNATTTLEKQERKVTNMAVIAQDLGFVAGHIPSCKFECECGVLSDQTGGLWTGERGQESDAETADSNLHGDEGSDLGEDESVGQAQDSCPDLKGDMEDKMGKAGSKDDAQDGLGAGWMGEGLDFWLRVEE